MSELDCTVNYIAPRPTGFMRCFAARRLVDSSISLLLRGPDEHLPHQQGPNTAPGFAAHVRGSEVTDQSAFLSLGAERLRSVSRPT